MDDVVDGAQVVDGLREGTLDRGFVGDVAVDGQSAGRGGDFGELIGGSGSGLLIEVPEGDVGAFGGEGFGGGAADAAGGAGDYGDVVLEVEVHGWVSAFICAGGVEGEICRCARCSCHRHRRIDR